MTDATTPAVVQDAQRYGHDEAMADIFDLAHIETEFEGHDPRVTGLAAYIERLEAEHAALLAEHKEGSACGTCGNVRSTVERANATYVCKDPWHAAHDNAERVLRGE